MNKNFIFTAMAIFCSLFLSGCWFTNLTCPQEDLQVYLVDAGEINDTFHKRMGEYTNNPARRIEILKELQTLKTDYDAKKVPLCTQKHKKLIVKAMDSSIKYLDFANDRYYTISQLSEFMYNDWAAVDKEMKALTGKYLQN